MENPWSFYYLKLTESKNLKKINNFLKKFSIFELKSRGTPNILYIEGEIKTNIGKRKTQKKDQSYLDKERGGWYYGKEKEVLKMYNYITGIIKEIGTNFVVIENNNIGYQIYVGNPYVYRENLEYTIYLYNYIINF